MSLLRRLPATPPGVPVHFGVYMQDYSWATPLYLNFFCPFRFWEFELTQQECRFFLSLVCISFSTRNTCHGTIWVAGNGFAFRGTYRYNRPAWCPVQELQEPCVAGGHLYLFGQVWRVWQLWRPSLPVGQMTRPDQLSVASWQPLTMLRLLPSRPASAPMATEPASHIVLVHHLAFRLPCCHHPQLRSKHRPSPSRPGCSNLLPKSTVMHPLRHSFHPLARPLCAARLHGC